MTPPGSWTPSRSASRTRSTACSPQEVTAAGDVPPFAVLGDGRLRACIAGPAGRTPDDRRRVARRRAVRPPRSPTARRSGSRPARRSRRAPPPSSARRTPSLDGDAIAIDDRGGRAGPEHPRRRRGHARRRRRAAPPERGSGPPSSAPPSPPASGALVGRPPAAGRGAPHRRRAPRRRASRSAPGEIHNSNAPDAERARRPAGGAPQPPQRLRRRPRRHRGGTRARARARRRRDRHAAASPSARTTTSSRRSPRSASREVFWGVALQPGKPTWFGTQGRHARVRPARQPGVGGRDVLAVRRARRSPRCSAPPPRGTAGQRRRCSATGVTTQPQPRAGGPGPPRAHRRRQRPPRPNGPQGSHIVTSLLGADALALIPAGEAPLPAGSQVGSQHLAR